MTRIAGLAALGAVLIGPLSPWGSASAAASGPQPEVPATASTTLQVIADADVWVSSWSATTVTACAAGVVDHGTPTAGAWTFTVAGASTATPVASAPGSPKSGSVFPVTCTTVPFSTGGVALTLTYTGVGVSGGDVTAVCGVVAVRGTGPTEVAHCSDSV